MTAEEKEKNQMKQKYAFDVANTQTWPVESCVARSHKSHCNHPMQATYSHCPGWTKSGYKL